MPRLTPTQLPARSAISLGARPLPRNARCARKRTAACPRAHSDTATEVASNVNEANVMSNTEGRVALKSTFKRAFPTSTSTNPIRRRKYPKAIVDTASASRAFASPITIGGRCDRESKGRLKRAICALRSAWWPHNTLSCGGRNNAFRESTEF